MTLLPTPAKVGDTVNFFWTGHSEPITAVVTEVLNGPAGAAEYVRVRFFDTTLDYEREIGFIPHIRRVRHGEPYWAN